ncbi:MAG: YaiI/YqxD family protein [Deltaproteobacteria bacterium]|nr:YaiI/YqxD family protein [Deltaproteobacteria bacterium]
MTKILVDADGCPVKEEVFQVAKRHGLEVTLVANSWMRFPDEARIELVLVKDSLDAADDWIVDHVTENDIVITGDIPLASRCLERGAQVLGPKGRVFTEDSISGFLASRELSSHLREFGIMTGGPAPFQKRDRSRFLHALDEMIRTLIGRRPRT